jgi:hypothetical protein
MARTSPAQSRVSPGKSGQSATAPVVTVPATTYKKFLTSKVHSVGVGGFPVRSMPKSLFDFQEFLIEWTCGQGRSAEFADCGLGKTVMELAWADNLVRHMNRPVLILTPLAVGAQTVSEGEKFGIECKRSLDGTVHRGINIANYERLHYFNPADFEGVVCDESSILKSFDGERRKQITSFLRKVPYRLLATATAAPNDYIELGTSSEALGFLGHTDMLNRFFKNDRNNSATGRAYGKAMEWRFKGHAEVPFWRWVASWAMALRKPSDLGFDDAGFNLPALHEREHTVKTTTLAPGMLFALPATNMREEREERRRTIIERCEKMALLADTKRPVLAWCHLNDEGNILKEIIPGAVQVAGNDSDEDKEEKFTAFVNGQIRVIVTKPKIGAWGLNFQHCDHVVSFPSHSFEQYYQSIRRCWRFGQQNPVTVDMIMTEGEVGVLANLRRKQLAADKMFSQLVEHMVNNSAISTRIQFHEKEILPLWL